MGQRPLPVIDDRDLDRRRLPRQGSFGDARADPAHEFVRRGGIELGQPGGDVVIDVGVDENKARPLVAHRVERLQQRAIRDRTPGRIDSGEHPGTRAR